MCYQSSLFMLHPSHIFAVFCDRCTNQELILGNMEDNCSAVQGVEFEPTGPDTNELDQAVTYQKTNTDTAPVGSLITTLCF